MPPIIPEDIKVPLDLDIEHVPPPVPPDVHGEVTEVAPVFHQFLPGEGESPFLAGDVDVACCLRPSVCRHPDLGCHTQVTCHNKITQ